MLVPTRTRLCTAAALALLGPLVAVPASAQAASSPAPIRVTVLAEDGGALSDLCVVVYATGDQGSSRTGEVCAAPGSSTVEIGPDLQGSTGETLALAVTSALYLDAFVGGEDFADATRLHPGDDVRVTLRRAGLLSGSLTFPDGQPVPDGDVGLLRSGRWLDVAVWVDQGRWRVKVPAGSYVLRYDVLGSLQYSGGVDTEEEATGYTVAVGQEVHVSEVFLGPGEPGTATVSGRVREAGTGVALAGVCVRGADVGTDDPQDPDDPGPIPGEDRRTDGAPAAAGPATAARAAAQAHEPPCPEGEAVTDAAGRYELVLPIVTGHRYQVVVTDPSGAHVVGSSAPRLLGVDEAAVQDVQVVRTGSLTGRVVDRVTGAPLAQVCPQVYGRDGFTNPEARPSCSGADGWWSVSGVAPGLVTVSLNASGPRPWLYVPGVVRKRDAARVLVRPGQEVRAPQTALPKGGTLTGTVRDRAGKPVRGITVSLGEWSDGFGTRPPSATTDAYGHYVITGLDPGRAVVQVAPDNAQSRKWARSWSNVSDPRKAQKVRVDWDTTTTFDAVVSRGGAVAVTLSGAGLPTDGNPVWVEAFSTSGASLGLVGTAMPGDGPTTIGQLPAGDVLLKATVTHDADFTTTSWWYRAPGAPGSDPSPVRVTPGRTTALTLVLSP